MIERIGDLAQNDRLGALLRRTQMRVREAQVAVASGHRTERWDRLGDRAGMLVALREQRGLTAGFLAENDELRARLGVVEATLGSIGEIAERLRTLLVARLNDASGASIPLDAEVAAMAAELESLLNRQVDGAYLFAGSRSDRPPVELPEPLPVVADPALYYRGDEVALAFQADVGVEIAYGVRASAAPFAELVAALGQARAAHVAHDRAGLEAALSRVSGAIAGIAGLRAGVGAVDARLEAFAETQRGTLVQLDALIGETVDTDLAETMSRLARDQAALEASYLVIARLNQLNLADYLR
ncbi:MAG: flagellin [Geminicoccaceae bacterium]|nr:flagellin [Geminicoccaceae bacterium]MCS7267772.1 flagellin [Geminicoccaceae bacterium]MCX7628943.1 flagellin [Geminicoccaceae bacterium]MDW8124326.1 flagellin [Geminicoccaceae bacterium]MDW8340369.1 flagellin [Geminicoccaceae bacterium]